MAITKGSWKRSLIPNLTKYLDLAKQDYDSCALKVFHNETSDRDSEDRTIVSGLGLASALNEGSAVTYDTMAERWHHRVQHTRYANGFIVTQDQVDDDKADQIMKMKAPALKKSMMEAREVIGINILNRAFSSTYTFGDGKELCATDHPLDTSTYTNSNELATATTLSEASLEQCIKDLSQIRDQRGLRKKVEARKLIIHPDNIMEAQRILKSDLRVNTANNDLNAIKDLNLIPEGCEKSIYLTSRTPFFLLTDVNEGGEGLVYFERSPLQLKDDSDFDTFNMKNIVTMRFSFTVFNSLGIYGSVGTGT